MVKGLVLNRIALSWAEQWVRGLNVKFSVGCFGLVLFFFCNT